MSFDRFPTDFDLDDIDHDGQGRGLVFFGGMQHPGSTLFHDSSLYGNHGTLTNMDPATDWVEGPHGPALDFDGSDDVVSRSTVGLGLTNASEVTASFWARNLNVNSLRGVFYINPTGNDSTYLLAIYFHTDANKSLIASTQAGFGDFAALPASNFDDSQWNHIVVTKPSGAGVTPTIYTNGILNSTPYNVGLSGWDTNVFHLGRGLSSSFYATCQLSDPRIYNRALSDSEVWDLYSNPTGIILPRRRVFSGTAVEESSSSSSLSSSSSTASSLSSSSQSDITSSSTVAERAAAGNVRSATGWLRLDIKSDISNVVDSGRTARIQACKFLELVRLYSGVSANEINRAIVAKDRLITPGNTDDIDLYDWNNVDVGLGYGRDHLGQYAIFEEVVAFVIYQSAGAGRLEIMGSLPSRRALWVPQLTVANGGALRTGGAVVMFQPATDGFDVYDGVSHNLRLGANGGLVYYDIFVMGRHDDDESSSSSS